MLKASGRGFSLIELMVAVSVIVILMAVAMPSFSTWIRNARIRTVAEALQSSIRLAQTEAQRRNQSTVLFRTDSKDCTTAATASATGMQWQLRSVPGIVAPGAPEAIQCGVLTDVASGLSLSATDGATSIAAICFSADGRQTTLSNPASIGVDCTAASLSFRVAPTSGAARADDRPLQLNLALSGALRMCDPGKASTASDGCRP
jgi:type IV fimbrial biogenesis protein FimT